MTKEELVKTITEAIIAYEKESDGLLMQMLIEQSSNEGDLVLDPFMGSGTTAIACIRSSRNYIGSEIDKRYFDVCNERVKCETLQLNLFNG